MADSYLFIRGANRYANQRTRALAAVRSGKKGAVAAVAEEADESAIRYHKIKKGDTLGSISRKYRISIDRLCRLNGIKRTTTLRIGQVLKCS